MEDYEEKRKSQVLTSEKLIGKIQEELENSDPDFEDLKGFILKLEKSQERVAYCDEKIFKDLLKEDKQEEIETEMLSATERKENINVVIADLKKLYKHQVSKMASYMENYF